MPFRRCFLETTGDFDEVLEVELDTEEDGLQLLEAESLELLELVEVLEPLTLLLSPLESESLSGIVTLLDTPLGGVLTT